MQTLCRAACVHGGSAGLVEGRWRVHVTRCKWAGAVWTSLGRERRERRGRHCGLYVVCVCFSLARLSPHDGSSGGGTRTHGHTITERGLLKSAGRVRRGAFEKEGRRSERSEPRLLSLAVPFEKEREGTRCIDWRNADPRLSRRRTKVSQRKARQEHGPRNGSPLTPLLSDTAGDRRFGH